MTRFDPASIEKYVQAELVKIPKSKSMAFVATAGLDGSVEFRYAHRIGDEWTLGAVVRKERGRQIEGGVQVMWTR